MARERIISPSKQKVDAQVEATSVAPTKPSIRPVTLDQYLGQSELRERLSIALDAAKERNDPMEHVLLYGPPGLGKTTLAHVIANELGTRAWVTSGPALTKGSDLVGTLTRMEPNDVLFIDEIHRLNPVVEEILYPAMEDFQLDLVIGEGPAARSVRIDLPPFTLVGATTRSGLIATPLRDRFGIPMRLSFYETAELQKIVSRGAGLFNISLSDDGAAEIARRSRGTPRIAGRLLRRVRDFATVEGDGVIDVAIADAALQRLEVDSEGLDEMDRRYLLCIAEKFSGGPVGVETLAASLAEERDTIEDVIEPYLIQQGYLMRTPRGRVVTARTYGHLGLAAPDQVGQLDLIAHSDEGGDTKNG